MNVINWTGERFIPGFGGTQIRYEHMHRYATARQFVKDKNVLDYGSGEGYGTASLSSGAIAVTGVDVDPEAIAHATQKYHSIRNISFQTIEDHRLPYEDGSFDLITCFEVIEHVPNPELVIAELARLLTEDGVLLISTPNKAEYSDKNNYKNEFHLKEFYIEEFRQFLQKHFINVHFFGQKLISSSLLWSIDHDTETLDFAWEDIIPPGVMRSVLTPVYVIAQCSVSTLSEINGSLYMTHDDSLSDELQDSVPRTRVNEILEAMDEERLTARKQLDEYEAELIARANALETINQTSNNQVI